jgi:adenylosuccinate synthase
MIIEEKDRAFERKGLTSNIGSTGQGVGSATARRIAERGQLYRGRATVRMAKDIKELKPFIQETAQVLDRAFAEGKKILLEGTQGASLSLYHGNYPWVTSRDTNVSGNLAEAGISPRRVRKVIMVCRTYPIRVGGTSGPMSQEISRAEIARRSKLSYAEILRVERTSTTNKSRRIAEFDWVQLHRSTMLNGPTDIGLTFVDYLDRNNRKARRFEQLTEETIRFIEDIERVAGAPVSLISTRFHSRSIIDRRAWL